MEDNVEILILSNLIHNDSFGQKVGPFLKPEYFSDDGTSTIFKLAANYMAKYKALPTKEALGIELGAINLNGGQYDQAKKILGMVSEPSRPASEDWLIETTEKFCKDKAIYNAIMASIKILDGAESDANRGALPKLLSDALGVSFDANVGHDFLEDAEERIDFYHRTEERIPFDIEILNKITKGGLPRKTLNVLLAGCVHPQTRVRAQVKQKAVFTGIELDSESDIAIVDIKGLLEKGAIVRVDSPDGWVPVTEFVEKGWWDEYLLLLDDGRTVACNEDHLFMTHFGWTKASEIAALGQGYDMHIKTREGWVPGRIKKTDRKIQVVDIVVDHPNHQYYTAGVVSHNTNVGKTLAMCHMAAGHLNMGKNVLYITMEMAEERISERIDANLLDVALDDLQEMPKDVYLKKMARLKAKITGKLIVKEFPTSTAGAAHFRHLLNELRLKKGFVPDIIYIDYINICCSTRMKLGGSINSYSLIKAIAEELRGLAVEFNVPLVTATQTTRSGFSNSDPGVEDTSESFGLPATADFMLAMITNEQLEAISKIMFKQLKSRYRDKTIDKRFTIGVDRPKMRLYDAEDPMEGLMQDEDSAPKKGWKPVPSKGAQEMADRLTNKSGGDKPLNRFGGLDYGD